MGRKLSLRIPDPPLCHEHRSSSVGSVNYRLLPAMQMAGWIYSGRLSLSHSLLLCTYRHPKVDTHINPKFPMLYPIQKVGLHPLESTSPTLAAHQFLLNPIDPQLYSLQETGLRLMTKYPAFIPNHETTPPNPDPASLYHHVLAKTPLYLLLSRQPHHGAMQGQWKGKSVQQSKRLEPGLSYRNSVERLQYLL